MPDQVVIRWLILLSFALVGPIQLPAASLEPKKIQLRRRQIHEPMISTGQEDLRVAPFSVAPLVSNPGDVGAPMRVLRQWREHPDRAWLLVKTPFTRGWVCTIN